MKSDGTMAHACARRGYACLSAEGSGHAGHPACAHMLRAARCSQAGGVEATAAAALAAQT